MLTTTAWTHTKGRTADWHGTIDLCFLLGQLEVHDPPNILNIFKNNETTKYSAPVSAAKDDESKLIAINFPDADIFGDEAGRMVTPFLQQGGLGPSMMPTMLLLQVIKPFILLTGYHYGYNKGSKMEMSSIWLILLNFAVQMNYNQQQHSQTTCCNPTLGGRPTMQGRDSQPDLQSWSRAVMLHHRTKFQPRQTIVSLRSSKQGGCTQASGWLVPLPSKSWIFSCMMCGKGSNVPGEGWGM